MTTIAIKGMKCPHCIASAQKALEEIEGISNVRVDLEKKQATYDGDVDRETVKNAIARIGYEVIE